MNPKERLTQWVRGLWSDPRRAVPPLPMLPDWFLEDLAQVLGFPDVPALLGQPPEGQEVLPGLGTTERDPRDVTSTTGRPSISPDGLCFHSRCSGDFASGYTCLDCGGDPANGPRKVTPLGAAFAQAAEHARAASRIPALASSEACTCGPRDARSGEAAGDHDPDCPRSPLFASLLETMTKPIDRFEARRIMMADRAASEGVKVREPRATITAPPPTELFEAQDDPACTHQRTEPRFPNNQHWRLCLDCGDVVSAITGDKLE